MNIKEAPLSQETCQSLGMKMVTIKTEEENEFIRQIVDDQKAGLAWIGLKYEEGWKWQDGEKLDSYKNWLNGYPNRGDQWCAKILTKGRWYTTYCSDASFFVCEQ